MQRFKDFDVYLSGKFYLFNNRFWRSAHKSVETSITENQGPKKTDEISVFYALWVIPNVWK